MITLTAFYFLASHWPFANPFKRVFRPRVEDLRVEAALFRIEEHTGAEAYRYSLEVRIANQGDLPAGLQTIVCETSDKKRFPWAEEVFITEGKANQGPVLRNKNEVFLKDFPLELSSATQLEAAQPRVFVTTHTGKVYEAEVNPQSLDQLKRVEACAEHCAGEKFSCRFGKALVA